jgi:hypothetical protein
LGNLVLPLPARLLRVSSNGRAHPEGEFADAPWHRGRGSFKGAGVQSAACLEKRRRSGLLGRTRAAGARRRGADGGGRASARTGLDAGWRRRRAEQARGGQSGSGPAPPRPPGVLRSGLRAAGAEGSPETKERRRLCRRDAPGRGRPGEPLSGPPPLSPLRAAGLPPGRGAAGCGRVRTRGAPSPPRPLSLLPLVSLPAASLPPRPRRRPDLGPPPPSRSSALGAPGSPPLSTRRADPAGHQGKLGFPGLLRRPAADFAPAPRGCWTVLGTGSWASQEAGKAVVSRPCRGLRAARVTEQLAWFVSSGLLSASVRGFGDSVCWVLLAPAWTLAFAVTYC